MNLFIAGWTAVVLEIILLLIWIYSVFFTRNGTDPAGKGLATVFIIGLGIYIAAGVVLMLLQRSWSIILVLVMAAVPLALVIIGLLKKYGTGSR